MKLRIKTLTLCSFLICAAVCLHASITLFVEEPYGAFGAMNPTGHAAVYLNRVCAETPVKLRPCQPGESGVVISRYYRVGGYDWAALPLIPYLYAVDRPEEVPLTADRDLVFKLRDQYRREHLRDFVPEGPDGDKPQGDWTQLVGASYKRKIYALEVETTAAQDEHLIEELNSGKNHSRF